MPQLQTHPTRSPTSPLSSPPLPFSPNWERVSEGRRKPPGHILAPARAGSGAFGAHSNSGRGLFTCEMKGAASMAFTSPASPGFPRGCPPLPSGSLGLRTLGGPASPLPGARVAPHPGALPSRRGREITQTSSLSTHDGCYPQSPVPGESERDWPSPRLRLVLARRGLQEVDSPAEGLDTALWASQLAKLRKSPRSSRYMRPR